MSPLGLTTTGRAPFLYVVEPPYMMASTRAFLTYPRLSFPFRNGVPPLQRRRPYLLGLAHRHLPTPSSNSVAITSHPSLTQTRR